MTKPGVTDELLIGVSMTIVGGVGVDGPKMSSRR
jgi:hypothetical protein